MLFNNFITSFFISFLTCILLIYLDKLAERKGDLNLRQSPQTLHSKSISRFGGVAVAISLITVLFFKGYGIDNSLFFLAITCCLPAFLAGYLDDLKIDLIPTQRLLMLVPVPILFFYFTNLEVRSLNLGIYDDFLNIDFFAIFFLVFAIVGMINAFNLIDGVNGLLGAYIFSILIALQVRDQFFAEELFYLADYPIILQILTGALLGFFVLNIFGKIFMGDAGSYFLGALVCWVLIHQYQTINASAWSVMLLLSYPFTDLVFSVVRRKFITKNDPLQPDSMHLHHVLLKRIGKLNFKKDRAKHLMVALALFIFNLPYQIAAVYYYKNSTLLMFVFAFYILSYLLFYFSLSPRFLLRKE